MPKRSSKKLANPKPVDESGETEPVTEPDESPLPARPDGKNPAAVALGRLGGKKGGLARAKKLTAAQRRAIAKKAAEARWRKKNA